MKKKVIFSAIVGNYDKIKQPNVIKKEYDYIIFSNDISKENIGIWKISPIPYNNKDKTRIARWVKTHPHILLKEYDCSIWIDANVVIASDEFYTIIESLYQKKISVSSIAHPERDCIYDEGLTIFLYQKDTIEHVLRIITYIKHNGYPQHNGLCETNCLYRIHNLPDIIRFNEDWWFLISHFSKRDQLSYNYIIWKLHLPLIYLLGRDYCTRNHNAFQYTSHYKETYSASFEEIVAKGYHSYKIKKTYEKIIQSKTYSIREKFYIAQLLFYCKYLKLLIQTKELKYRFSIILTNIKHFLLSTIQHKHNT